MIEVYIQFIHYKIFQKLNTITKFGKCNRYESIFKDLNSSLSHYSILPSTLYTNLDQYFQTNSYNIFDLSLTLRRKSLLSY